MHDPQFLMCVEYPIAELQCQPSRIFWRQSPCPQYFGEIEREVLKPKTRKTFDHEQPFSANNIRMAVEHNPIHSFPLKSNAVLVAPEVLRLKGLERPALVTHAIVYDIDCSEAPFLDLQDCERR